MREFEKPLKALANRRRLAILTYLKKSKEEAVSDIAASLRLSVKATSKHLVILAGADILERDQRGLQMYYRISDQAPASAKAVLKLL